MLGWEIHITNGATGQSYADWLAGLGGRDWIEKLVKAGKAEEHVEFVGSTYYLIKAKDLVPAITSSKPNSKELSLVSSNKPSEGGWISDVKIDVEALKACLGHEVLRIQTYDAS